MNTQSAPLRPGPVRVAYDPGRLNESLGSGEMPRAVTAFMDLGSEGGLQHRWDLAQASEGPLRHDFYVPSGVDHARVWFIQEMGPHQRLADSAYGADYHYRVAPAHPDPTGYERLEYVRRPHGEQDEEKLDKLIDGAKRAVVESYEPWVHREPPPEPDAVAFTEMMQSMHRTIVETGYSGYLEYADGGWRRPAPGQLFFKGTEQEPLAFNLRLADLPDAQRFRWHPGKYFLPHPIDGVEEAAPPRNRGARTNGYLLHEYRRGHTVRSYLARTTELDHALRAAVWEGRPAEALVRLSQYFHTGINGHFFESVNNSLLMAQVNHTLHEMAMVGIPAESLDYIALANGEAEAPGSTRFRDFFLDAVLARNPDAAEIIAAARAMP